MLKIRYGFVPNLKPWQIWSFKVNDGRPVQLLGKPFPPTDYVDYAYLADVPPHLGDGLERLTSYQNSQSFTRGWALQDLLAPTE